MQPKTHHQTDHSRTNSAIGYLNLHPKLYSQFLPVLLYKVQSFVSHKHYFHKVLQHEQNNLLLLLLLPESKGRYLFVYHHSYLCTIPIVHLILMNLLEQITLLE